MEISNERIRRVVLSLSGLLVFFYTCFFLPFFRVLPYATMKETLYVVNGVSADFYYNSIQIRWWALIGLLSGKFDISYSTIGKDSDFWYLWYLTHYWGPISMFLVLITCILLLVENLVIILRKKPIFQFTWKIILFFGIAAVFIEWLLLFTLWFSGTAHIITDIGNIGITLALGPELFFFNLWGVIALTWSSLQLRKLSSETNLFS